MNSTFIGLSTGVRFPHVIAFSYVKNDFEVRGDKNHVDENVSEHGISAKNSLIPMLQVPNMGFSNMASWFRDLPEWLGHWKWPK